MATRLAFIRAIFLLVGLSMLPLAGQDIVSVQVLTEPSGARYTVDGLQYIQPTTFLWPVGSKHVVSIVSPTYSQDPAGGVCETPTDSPITQYDPSCSKRYRFSGWLTSQGASPENGVSQVVTADPKLTFVRASFTIEYRLYVTFFDRGSTVSSDSCVSKAQTRGPRPASDGSGVAFVGGQCLDSSGYVWSPPGVVTLQAVPFDGFVFRGWTFDSTPREGAQASSIEVRGPMVINPRFEPAKRVRLYSNPLGLRLRVDSTEVLTIDPAHFVVTYPIPGYFDWVGGSRHTLAGVSPQLDIDNRVWVFKNWSNGGGQNMIYSADNQTNVALELTANFVRGVAASFLTEPLGLKLNIEGRDNWPTTNFVWGVGMTYTVTAPPEQTDSKGRKYTFQGWSNAGPATQQITPEESQIVPGIRMIAKFAAVPQALIQSSIPGMKIGIDGGDCISPCRVDRPTGTVLKIVVPAVVPISEVSRYEFTGWSDGAPAERTLTLNSDSQSVVAMYRVANRLMAVADPGEGATFRLQPASADGFYPADSDVTILAETKPGFKFRRWDGDLSGTFRSGVVSMSMSRIVRAMLDRVPYVAPAGVRNAAADLPEPGVAPGLIAIYGGSLGKTFEVGSSNPLPQTLGGTVVLVGDRLLGLIYVSPDQINAQLPGDLEPGDYSLTVRTEGMADVKSDFTVVRNAPGLFVNMVDTTPFAVALHEDGSPVTTGSPAKRTETISLIGTGFGPYNRRVLDGFLTPATPVAALVDPVDVVVGGVRVTPSFAGAASGLTGMTATRFRVGPNGSGTVEVKVIVNGKESNTVILPVE
jgi:uncharacterized protein (TIGR03437 family)